MKNYIRRLMCLVLSIVMAISVSITNINLVTVKATQNKTTNFNKNYSITGDGSSDIVRIAAAQEGKTGSQFGYTEQWCADFVSDCAILANQSKAIPSAGYCPTLRQNIINAGGHYVSKNDAKAGDIAFYGTNGADHVEIVYAASNGNVSTYGGNSGSGSSLYSRMVKKHPTQTMSITYIVRPNYTMKTYSNPTVLGTYWGNETNETMRPVVNIANPDAVEKVRFAVWSTGDQSDLMWFDSRYNGNGAFFQDIEYSHFKNKTYICHVYVYGKNGNVNSMEMRLDKTNYSKPKIEVSYWGDSTDTTFRPVVKISNPSSVQSVKFAVWSTDDQSDLKWYGANYNGAGSFFRDIKYSDLKTQRYYCHVYVYGNDGSTQASRLTTFDTYDAEGGYESATGGIGSFTIKGYAYDRSNLDSSIYVHCYLKDSQGKATLMGGYKADQERSDVNNRLGVGAKHGFLQTIMTSMTGTYTVEVSAINIGGGRHVTFLGSYTVTIKQPVVSFDSSGGSKCESKKITNTEKYGKLPATTRTGYDFDGWYTQKIGGDKITEDTVAKLTNNQTLYAHWIKQCEHKNTEIRDKKAATCKEEGYTGDIYCKDCNTKLSSGKTVTKTEDHVWDSGKITKQSTCTQKGEKTYTCKICSEIKIEEIKATGHLHQETKNKKAAACEKKGYTGDVYCSDCGEKLQSGKETSALGHTWDDGIVTKEATETTEGIKIYTCKTCQKTREEVIPIKKHNMDNGVVTKQPTCTEDGERTYTCTDEGCEYTYTQKILSTGHQYNAWKIVTEQSVFTPENQERICDICGKKEERIIGEKLKPTIKVSTTSLRLFQNQSTDGLGVYGLEKGDYINLWISSDTKIATIKGKSNGSCTIKAGSKIGTAKITIILGSGLKKTVTVTVSKKMIDCKSISNIPKKLTIKKKKTYQLKPVINPKNCTYKAKYTTSNKKIAKVDAKGKITGVKKGKTKITIIFGKKKVVCMVTVK